MICISRCSGIVSSTLGIATAERLDKGGFNLDGQGKEVGVSHTHDYSEKEVGSRRAAVESVDMDPGRADERQSGLQTGDRTGNVAIERVESGSAWDLLARADPPLAVWMAPDGTRIVGSGTADEIVGTGSGPIAQQRDQIIGRYDHLGYDGPDIAAPRYLGGIQFSDHVTNSARWDAFPGRWFFLPKHQVVEQGNKAWLTTIGESHVSLSKPAGDSNSIPNRIGQSAIPTRETWLDQVQRAKAEIRDNQYDKVVLAHSLELDLDSQVPLLALVKQLRRSNPACYVTVVQPTSDKLFVAATPERLVTRTGDTVRTDALAGSTERGSTAFADNRLSSALADSEKNSFEHELVVDSITSGLEGFGGDVRVGDRRIHQLRSVQHLHTPIQATYTSAPHVLDLVDTLHPTPAVGGFPKRAALDAINRIETIARGWYAAPIGWIDPSGNGTFAIGIRSALIDSQQATLFAGNGIVADSVPTDEWDELQLKYRPLLSTFEKA